MLKNKSYFFLQKDIGWFAPTFDMLDKVCIFFRLHSSWFTFMGIIVGKMLWKSTKGKLVKSTIIAIITYPSHHAPIKFGSEGSIYPSESDIKLSVHNWYLT